MRRKFEYWTRHRDANDPLDERELDSDGEDGWELVNVRELQSSNTLYLEYIFKRELPNNDHST